MIFLITYSVTLDVSAQDIIASVSKELVDEGTWSISASAREFDPYSTNCTMPLHTTINTNLNGWEDSYYYFYRYFGLESLFTTDTDYYAYRIVFEKPTKFSLTSENDIWMRTVIGTMGEISDGSCQYGTTFSSSNSPSFWYVTNNAEVTLRAAVMGYWVGIYSENSTSDLKFYPSYNCTASIKYKVYGYTKADYNTAMNNKLAESNELQAESNELQKEQNETNKGILSKISEFFGSFFSNLTNLIIRVIVPTSDEMGVLFDRLNQFFSDTFGFLYYPFEFLIQAFDVFIGSSIEVPSITFPGFSIMEYQVWESQEVTFEDNQIALTIFASIRMVTGVILSFAFVNYLRVFFDKRFGGGGS